MSSGSLSNSQDFSALFAAWLRIRAQQIEPSTEPVDDETFDALSDEERRAVDTMIAVQATNLETVHRKMEVIRYLLVDDAGQYGKSEDPRILAMVASVQRDVSALTQLRAFTC